WPVLTTFNWALDYFDRIPDGDATLALQIANDDAPPERYTFGELSRRSNQVANHLRKRNVQRGDRILMVLGNEVALWETMLGAFKLGAVVIPTTEMLTPEDIRDRLERAEVRHVVVGASQVDK